MNPPQDIITFRLLCHEEKVGGVIGKGGTIVKALQHETGCEIKILERVPDSEDRVIVISGPAVWFDTLNLLRYVEVSYAIFFVSCKFSCFMKK